MHKTKDMRNPSELVAIAYAAHATGNRELERAAKQELLSRHEIEIRFRRPKRPAREVASC